MTLGNSARMLSPAVSAVRPLVLGDLAIHDRAMGIEQTQRSSLIGIHEAQIAGHVSVEDGREAALHD
ncbi:hypothetical protein [Microvirga lenta]|uniref:hypothetical protein n=1 Tax=Microvirga lenta TaxID=2881337 RepID=UPI001CFF57DE|nr:hypothetical protein [Microvirga lenta]MCB5176911.1 hypothetical protein [Microvirga lenta]